MDFGALPPEINSARMYSGYRAESMLAAAAAWVRLADDLYGSAASYQEIITTLTDEDWRGPASESMLAAVAQFMSWLRTTVAHAQDVASEARAAASAFETALAATVPPPVIEANRARLASLIAENAISHNTSAITAVESDYAEMWAQDASAMYRYAGASAAATTLTPLAPPWWGDDEPGLMGVDSSPDDAQDALAQATSAVPQALRALAQPLQSKSTSAAMAGLLKQARFAAPMGSFASAISAAKTLTSSGTSAAMSTKKHLGSPQMAVSLALGQGVSVGRLSVPRNWGEAAFGSLRSVA
jgi:PPE-repeat protein